MTSSQKIFLTVIILALAGIILGTALYPHTPLEKPNGITVVATFYPLYFFAHEIAGDKATVTMLIPDNVEPHTWEPSISDIMTVTEANVFIYNGAGFEPWVSDFLSSIQTKNLVIVDASTNVDLQLPKELAASLQEAAQILTKEPFQQTTASMTTNNMPILHDMDTCINLTLPTNETRIKGYCQISIEQNGYYGIAVDQNESITLQNTAGQTLQNTLKIPETLDYPTIKLFQTYELSSGNYTLILDNSTNTALHMTILYSETPLADTEHGATDPHFWLDPIRAKTQVDNIAEGLINADPTNATVYTQNANQLKTKLDSLNQEYQIGLRNRTKNDIVTTHEGFDYLAERYGFNAHAAIGISADAQPSTQDMARLVQLVENLDLHYVFVEPIFSDVYMNTIAEETNSQILILDGIHGRTGVHAGMDYFQIMEDNLKNLEIGLEVK
jgi:zinc transport system substrate-binding protein